MIQYFGKGCDSNENNNKSCYSHFSCEVFNTNRQCSNPRRNFFRKKKSVISKQCIISRHLLKFSQFSLLKMVNVTLPKVEERARIFPLEVNFFIKNICSMLRTLTI